MYGSGATKIPSTKFVDDEGMKGHDLSTSKPLMRASLTSFLPISFLIISKKTTKRLWLKLNLVRLELLVDFSGACTDQSSLCFTMASGSTLSKIVLFLSRIQRV
jgi:hypothetical protein